MEKQYSGGPQISKTHVLISNTENVSIESDKRVPIDTTNRLATEQTLNENIQIGTWKISPLPSNYSKLVINSEHSIPQVPQGDGVTQSPSKTADPRSPLSQNEFSPPMIK